MPLLYGRGSKQYWDTSVRLSLCLSHALPQNGAKTLPIEVRTLWENPMLKSKPLAETETKQFPVRFRSISQMVATSYASVDLLSRDILVH